MAAHIRKENFLLRQVDVFVLLNSAPEILHISGEVFHGDVVFGQLVSFRIVD